MLNYDKAKCIKGHGNRLGAAYARKQEENPGNKQDRRQPGEAVRQKPHSPMAHEGGGETECGGLGSFSPPRSPLAHTREWQSART